MFSKNITFKLKSFSMNYETRNRKWSITSNKGEREQNIFSYKQLPFSYAAILADANLFQNKKRH